MSDTIDWLAERHRALVDDLCKALDLPAALREATLAGRHRDLVASLPLALDVERGLNAILPTATLGLALWPVRAGGVRQVVTLVELGRILGSAAPRVRLALRATTRDLAHAVSLARDLILARDRAGDLVLTLALTEANDQVLGLARELAEALDHVRALDRDLDHTLDGLLDEALDLAERAAAPLPHARRDLAGYLAEACTVALAYPRPEPATEPRDKASAYALAGARTLALALARDLAYALDLARDLVLSRACYLDRVLDTDIDIDIERVDRAGLDFLLGVVDDVRGADLRDVDLTDLPLEGLRWSLTTRWPPRWVEHVRRRSMHICGTTYQIR
jgi:hypothetical protein